MLGTHSGQVFKISYDDSTSITSSAETSTTNEIPSGPSPFPIEIVGIGVGVVLIAVVIVTCVKKKK